MSLLTKNMEVNLAGKGKMTLRPSNYITTGGEASIYRANDLVIKLFTDPNKMSADKMAEKVELLAKLKHKFIVNPLGVVETNKGKPIGYYMAFSEHEPLSRVFTTAFRLREKFTDQDAVQLVHYMREIPIFAHINGATLVDANELNWGMKREQTPEPRIVDVDSWQIGSRWPARVIMPSIRDYHTHGFNEQSDWFSWAVVSFQVFSGIHPYRGRHPDYKPVELERRMRDNISVFHDDVRLTAVVRDFSKIPGPLLDWYQQVFEHGDRAEPPSPLTQAPSKMAVRQIQPIMAASGSLVFELLLEAGHNPVIGVWPCGVALRANGTLVELSTRLPMRTVTVNGMTLSASAEIVRVPHGYLVADGGKFLHVTSSEQTDLPAVFQSYGVLRSDNRLFAVTDSGLTELNFIQMGRASVLTLGQSWPIMRLATELFSGVAIQNSLGAKYLVVPFGEQAVGFFRAKELDDVTVITAKAGNRFVSVIALDKVGNYQKLEFAFDRDYTKYTLWSGLTDTPDLNLAILPSGVCATIATDGELSVFVPQNGKLTRVPDKKIATDMHLSTWGEKVVYIQNGELGWVRMK